MIPTGFGAPASGADKPGEGGAAAPLDRWLERHAGLVASIVLAVGLLPRLRAASYAYLNPDEAAIYILANQPSLVATYKLSLHEAHPPLWFFLLHFLRLLGHSELVLRLPSVLAGTVLPWFVYKWLKSVFGARTGWIGLLLLTFSPAMIVVSAEDRQYPLLLFFFAAALYFLERGLAEDSFPNMALFGLFLFLAVATHYSALWFATASGLYALGRIRRDPPSQAVTKAWLGSMAGAAALFVFFYITHIAQVRSNWLTPQRASRSWLSELFFQPGREGAYHFILNRSIAFFQYLFGQDLVGFVLFVLFLYAASLLLDARLPLPGKATPRLLALLLFLPFLLGSAAALVQLYPYGAGREALWLAPFAVAGVSYGLAQLGGRQRAWPGLGLAALVIAAGLWTIPAGIILSPSQSKRTFDAALNYIRQTVPQDQPILTDFGTMEMLGYYLCAENGYPYEALLHGPAEFRCGGFRFLVASLPSLSPANFLGALKQAAKTHGLTAGERLWVAHAGWGDQLQEKLASSFPELFPFARQDFNEGVAMFQVKIPQPDSAGR